jgi:HK97 family phage portal protein
MSILDSLRKLLGKDYNIVYKSYIESPSVLSLSPRELYATQANLYSVVSFLASSISQLPLKVYNREDEDTRVRDRNSTAAKLLFKPNSDQTQAEFIKALSIEYLLYGEALVWLLPDISESGYQLRIIPSDWVIDRKCFTNYSAATYKVRTQTGNTIEIDAKNIIDFREYAPGMPANHQSPISALKQTLYEQIEADKFRTSLWKSSGRMNAYISRPANVTPWTKETRDAWTSAFRRGWSEGGQKSGSMPILEDGMEIKTYNFNSKEAQYAEGKQLSREDVAAAYHVNPSLIWHTNTQTYASSKDNARALYAECLGPILQIFQQRINTFLLPMLGVDYNEYYVEFDLEEKLKGSFEERASIIQSAVGGPWMTRDEARAMNNMPPLPEDEGKGVIVPLNVLIGGQASPQDSVGDAYKKIEPCSCGCHTSVKEVVDEKPDVKKIDTEPTDEDKELINEVLTKFFKRQEKSVLSKLGAKSAMDQEWWDKDRWNKELSDDLYKILLDMATKKGVDIAVILDSYYNGEITENYIRKYVEDQAEFINDATYDKIIEVQNNNYSEDLTEDETEDDYEEPKTVQDVYKKRISFESILIAGLLAYGIYKFATKEAINQAEYQGKLTKTTVYKTWVTGTNPRPEHAIMNGETVNIDEKFSNGSDWTHDDILGPNGTCGCNCHIEVTFESK